MALLLGLALADLVLGFSLSWPIIPTLVLAALTILLGRGVFHFGPIFLLRFFASLLRFCAAAPFAVPLVMGLASLEYARESLNSDPASVLSGLTFGIFGPILIVAGLGFLAMVPPWFPPRIRLMWFTTGATVSSALALVFLGAMASLPPGDIAVTNGFVASLLGLVGFVSGLWALSLVFDTNRPQDAHDSTMTPHGR